MKNLLVDEATISTNLTTLISNCKDFDGTHFDHGPTKLSKKSFRVLENTSNVSGGGISQQGGVGGEESFVLEERDEVATVKGERPGRVHSNHCGGVES